jgi:hypothetical protein
VLSEEDANIPQSVRGVALVAGGPAGWHQGVHRGSEEFTVNIALIENGRVVFGVVSMPTNGRSMSAVPVSARGVGTRVVRRWRFRCATRRAR